MPPCTLAITPLFWYSPTRFSKKLVLPLWVGGRGVGGQLVVGWTGMQHMVPPLHMLCIATRYSNCNNRNRNTHTYTHRAALCATHCSEMISIQSKGLVAL